MTQIELIAPCRVPPEESQCYRILRYLESGGRLTVAKAMSELSVYALSQRVGELKREYGWPIKSRALKVGPKTYVAEYWMGEE
jgi:hypothetical protein